MIGFVYHFEELQAGNAFHNDSVWIELTELLAIVSGVFILRGQNWARWLAFAWMVFHVIVSIHDLRAFTMHCLICAAIAWCVFRPEAARYFRGMPAESK
jgi:hypothetical protein